MVLVLVLVNHEKEQPLWEVPLKSSTFPKMTIGLLSSSSSNGTTANGGQSLAICLFSLGPMVRLARSPSSGIMGREEASF